MDYNEFELSKRIARVFSMIFPGMGLVFYSKWKTGLIFIILHVLFGFYLVKKFIEYIAYHTHVPDGKILGASEVFIILIVFMVINWTVSLLVTEKANPNE